MIQGLHVPKNSEINYNVLNKDLPPTLQVCRYGIFILTAYGCLIRFFANIELYRFACRPLTFTPHKNTAQCIWHKSRRRSFPNCLLVGIVGRGVQYGRRLSNQISNATTWRGNLNKIRSIAARREGFLTTKKRLETFRCGSTSSNKIIGNSLFTLIWLAFWCLKEETNERYPRNTRV